MQFVRNKMLVSSAKWWTLQNFIALCKSFIYSRNRRDQRQGFHYWGRQGSTVTIKSRYVIRYMCQNFGVRNVCGQILKSIHQASYLLPSDFENNFSSALSYLNRMKDC